MPTVQQPGFYKYGQLPAGTYYIGDLCYIFTDEEWSYHCKQVFADGKQFIGIFHTRKNIPFANFRTKYGDGLYFGDDDDKYYVDSGTIGCFPLRDLPKDALENSTKMAKGIITTFDEPFNVYYNKGPGNIVFDPIYIYTGTESDQELNYCTDDE